MYLDLWTCYPILLVCISLYIPMYTILIVETYNIKKIFLDVERFKVLNLL